MIVGSDSVSFFFLFLASLLISCQESPRTVLVSNFCHCFSRGFSFEEVMVFLVWQMYNKLEGDRE